MDTKIQFYGMLTELANTQSIQLKIEENESASEITKKLLEKYPKFSEVPLVLFQHQKACTPGEKITPGVEIDCMPPFSGG